MRMKLPPLQIGLNKDMGYWTNAHIPDDCLFSRLMGSGGDQIQCHVAQTPRE